MLTIDRVREQIKKNFPKADAAASGKPKQLHWALETESSLITECARYRIARRTDDEGRRTYYVVTAPTPTQVPKEIGGPYDEPAHAKLCAQMHSERTA